MIRKVAIYARVSTEHEAQLSALENQIEYYDMLLENHKDWSLYKRYVDEGLSATSIKKRTNFIEMIKEAKEGYFDLIITREVSRFARNIVDTIRITRELKEYGVEVFFIEDNIWTLKDEDGELRLSILASLAQNESKKISQRVKAGQLISFKNGVFYGNGNILGYDKKGKNIIINKEQSKTVKIIFSLYLEGYGSKKIKEYLEKNNFKTAMGLDRWSEATIIRILSNPFYCGIIVYRKSFVTDYLEQKHVINHGEVEKIIVKGKHNPLVSEEDFYKVQKMIRSNSVIKSENYIRNGKPVYYWSKKLICSCGSRFNRMVKKEKKTGNKRYFYVCYSQKNYGYYNYRIKHNLSVENVCKIKPIPEWKLNLIAIEMIKLINKKKEKIEELYIKFIKDLKNDKNYKKSLLLKVTTINKLLVDENNRLDNLTIEYLDNKVLLKDYNKKRIEYQNRIKELESMKNNLKLEITNKHNIDKNKIYRTKKYFESCIEELNENNIEEFVLRNIDKIRVNNNIFECYLSYFSDLKEDFYFNNNDKIHYLSSKTIKPCNIRKYKEIINYKKIFIKDDIKIILYL